MEKSARERWIYIEGIVVSICLASIFLVALIVFFCYYRTQKSSGPPRCEISKSSSRGTMYLFGVGYKTLSVCSWRLSSFCLFFLFSVATPKHMCKVYISLYFLLNISICYWLQWHFNIYCWLLVFFFSEPILSAVKSKLPFRSHKRKSQGTARSSESYHKIADSDQSYKPEVEVSDIMQDRTDSASTLVIGQDPKRIAENQV